MRPGDLVRVKESRHFPGKFELYSLPSGKRTTYPLNATGMGIVLETKFYDVFYGTIVHVLTPRGHGWIYPDEVEVIR